MTDRPTVQPTARPTARTLDEAEQLIDRLQTEVRRLTRHAFALDRNWSSYADRNLAGIRAALGMMDDSSVPEILCRIDELTGEGATDDGETGGLDDGAVDRADETVSTGDGPAEPSKWRLEILNNDGHWCVALFNPFGTKYNVSTYYTNYTFVKPIYDELVATGFVAVSPDYLVDPVQKDAR